MKNSIRPDNCCSSLSSTILFLIRLKTQLKFWSATTTGLCLKFSLYADTVCLTNLCIIIIIIIFHSIPFHRFISGNEAHIQKPDDTNSRHEEDRKCTDIIIKAYCNNGRSQFYNVHRVLRREKNWYYLRYFNKLKFTVVIFSKQHCEHIMLEKCSL